jgi:hypothetical protein
MKQVFEGVAGFEGRWWICCEFSDAVTVWIVWAVMFRVTLFEEEEEEEASAASRSFSHFLLIVIAILSKYSNLSCDFGGSGAVGG